MLDGNAAAIATLGYESAAEAKTHNAATYYADPADREWRLAQVGEHGVVRSQPRYFRKKDGQVIPVLLTAPQKASAADAMASSAGRV